MCSLSTTKANLSVPERVMIETWPVTSNASSVIWPMSAKPVWV